jgi:two-component system, NtrC family, sensor histidine kinase HydH
MPHRLVTANPKRAGLLLKVGLPIIIVSSVLLAVGIVGAWHVHRLHKNSAEVLAVNVANIRAAEELEIVIRETRHRLYRFLATGNRTHLDDVPALRVDTEHWLKEAERSAATPREQELVAAIKLGYAHFVEEFSRLAELDPGGEIDFDEMKALARDVLENEVLVYTHEYLDLNEQEVTRNVEQNQQIARRLMLGLVLLGVCGSAAGLLAGYGIAVGIRRRIVQLGVPIRDVAGKLNDVVGPITVSADPGFDDLEQVLQNVSDRVATVVAQLERSQREMLRRVQLAAVGQLAAGLAHELRNPLMSMKFLVQSAVDRPERAGLDGRDLEVIDEEMERLEHLVQTFLDFARPPQLQRREVDLNSVIQQTVQFVAPRAERQATALEYEPSEQPIAIEADVAQVRQVLLNLLLNSLDAVRDGGRVQVEASHNGRAGATGNGQPSSDGDHAGWVSIRVSDTGCGLPKGSGERIYEPFFSTKETGIGLGLPISKRIIEDHGGEILAADCKEGGAVFTILLPARGEENGRPGDRRESEDHVTSNADNSPAMNAV